MPGDLFFAVDAGVRYWEDAHVNGIQEKEEGPVTVPGYVPPDKKPIRFLGGRWVFRINVKSGQIENWPKGVTVQTHYKVCDDGEYSYQRKDGTVLHSWDGYVPSCLAPSGGSFGDYIILDIDGDGFIKGWDPDCPLCGSPMMGEQWRSIASQVRATGQPWRPRRERDRTLFLSRVPLRSVSVVKTDRDVQPGDPVFVRAPERQEP